ncbi:DoxX family protein [Paenibacillus beijingensis]|uniref:Membrane protein n=1 Tax=Paenibacillus beijingensis TaxID=1126833 RepID=A0A0D5NP10_9BACL|nr:DoxX family protein [Paenibacillus beijingensis]AJY77011.1 membrane protein [Paenibacillus beijingensis]
MEPLIVLVVVTLAILVAGIAGVSRLRPWPVALRGGLAAMFILTGSVHFVYMRTEIIRMVPPILPYPDLIVTITGVLELAGAIGLLWRPTVTWAAGGLSLLLIAMFPANLYMAINGLATSPEDELIPRTLMQILFLSVSLTVWMFYRRHRSVRKQGNDFELSK